jgi:hypothetical protein
MPDGPAQEHETRPSAPEQVAALQYVVLHLLMVHREAGVCFLIAGALLFAQSPRSMSQPQWKVAAVLVSWLATRPSPAEG